MRGGSSTKPKKTENKPKPVVGRRRRPRKGRGQDTKKVKPSGTMLLADKFEQEIFNAQNRLRTNPQSFINYVQTEVGRFQGNLLGRPGRSSLMTNEGPSAWREAISALQQQRSLNSLQWSDGLAVAARDHCNDIGRKGLVQHNGSDGT